MIAQRVQTLLTIADEIQFKIPSNKKKKRPPTAAIQSLYHRSYQLSIRCNSNRTELDDRGKY